MHSFRKFFVVTGQSSGRDLICNEFTNIIRSRTGTNLQTSQSLYLLKRSLKWLTLWVTVNFVPSSGKVCASDWPLSPQFPHTLHDQSSVHILFLVITWFWPMLMNKKTTDSKSVRITEDWPHEHPRLEKLDRRCFYTTLNTSSMLGQGLVCCGLILREQVWRWWGVSVFPFIFWNDTKLEPLFTSFFQLPSAFSLSWVKRTPHQLSYPLECQERSLQSWLDWVPHLLPYLASLRWIHHLFVIIPPL